MSQLIRGQEQELELASQLERLKLPDTDAMEWKRPAGSSRQRVDSDDSDQVIRRRRLRIRYRYRNVDIRCSKHL